MAPLGTRRPIACLWLLVGSAAIDRYTVSVAGLHVFPEYVALALTLPVVRLAVRRGQFEWRWPSGAWLLLGWLLVALCASLLNAPQGRHSLILWNKLWMMVATYALVANLARGRLAAAVNAQLVAGVGVGAFGLLEVGLRAALGGDVGAPHQAYGTLREANVFGSYLLAASLLALPMGVTETPGSRELRVVSRLALALGTGGVVLSLTRAAWVGLAVAVTVAALVAVVRRPGVGVWRAAVGTSGVLALIFGLALSRGRLWSLIPTYDPARSGELMQRVASFGALAQDPDLQVRMDIYRNALVVWRQRPWIGWGVGAYGDMLPHPDPTGEPAWISNLFLHHLFDSGLIGLGFLLAGVGLPIWRGIQRWRSRRGITRAMSAGLLLALLGLLIAFQATEASWLAYPWIYLGMLEGASSDERHA